MNADAFVDELLAFVRAAVPEAINATLYRIEGVAKERAPVRNIFAEGMTRKLRLKTAAEFAGDMKIAASLSNGGHPVAVSTKTAEIFGRSKHGRSFSRGHTGSFMGSITFGGKTVRNRERAATPFANERTGYGTTQGGQLFRTAHAQGASLEKERLPFRAASNFESHSGGTRFMGHFLSARGRYEVKTPKRSFYKEEQTIGGRLRGEIDVIVAAEWEGEQIWGYVISPTPYAKYQEFGTRHNAAHPYLRPALRESAEVFLENMSVALRGGSSSRLKGARA